MNEEIEHGMKEFELKNRGFTEINYSKSSSVSTSDRSLLLLDGDPLDGNILDGNILYGNILDGNIFDGNSCFSLGVVISKKSSLSEYTRLKSYDHK